MSSLYQNRKLKCDKKPEPSPTVSVAFQSPSLSSPRSRREGQVESNIPGQKSRLSGVKRARHEGGILLAKMELEILSTKLIFPCQESMYDIVITHLTRCYMLAL